MLAATIPDKALTLIKVSEGLHKYGKDGKVYVYPDVAHGWSVATQGYGTTINPKTGRKLSRQSPPITPETASDWLSHDLRKTYLPAVDRYIIHDMHGLMRGALGSFTYNVGTGALKRSTLRKKINAGDWQGVAKQWRKWRMANGRVYSGLVKRREKELALFMEGVKALQAGERETPEISRTTFWQRLARAMQKIFMGES